MVAECLNISLKFPTRFGLGMEESVTGRGYVDGGWMMRDGEVTFRAENESLFQELLSHLDCEFDSFVGDFHEFKKVAASLVGGTRG